MAESAKREMSLGEAFEFVNQFRFGGITIAPTQIRQEIMGLLQRLQESPPRTVVEIGTSKGGTLFLLTQVAAPDARLVSIDCRPRLGDNGRWRNSMIRAFGRPDQELDVICADSHAPATVARLRESLGDRQIDFLFIDGDHSYAGAKRDLELYGPFVRRDGLIAMHDIVPGREENVGGVPDLWREVKASRVVQEFVADWAQGGLGIGVFSPLEN